MAEHQGKAAVKEVNSELKIAKEAMKQKEYKEALKHCKNALKIDKNNYHALVFIGLCAKEMEQFDQSRVAYRKAIDQNPEQILAWQGLCNLYESAAKDEWKKDLVEVYSKLINSNKSDIAKWKELLAKMIPLQLSLEMTSEAICYLKELEGTSPEPSQDLLNYWQKGLNLLQGMLLKEELTMELQDQVEHAFHSVLEYSRVLGIDTELPQQMHISFLKSSLKEIKEIDRSKFMVNRILQKGRSLLEEFPKNKVVLELMARILMDLSADEISEEVTNLVKAIREIDPENCVGVVGAAQDAVRSQDWIVALNSLKPFQDCMNKDYIAQYWLLMANIYLKLHDPQLALGYTEKGIAGVHRCITQTGREIYSNAFSACKASCLIEMKCYEQAKNILLEMIEKGTVNERILYYLGITYSRLKENEKATEICDRLAKINPSFHGILNLKALISINEGKLFDAELRLQEAIEMEKETAEYHFLLGKVYWDLKESDIEYAKKARGSFLRAAKLDAHNAEIFFILGEYYRHIASDLRKAQKCFQKAFYLNKLSEQAALALGDVSMDLGEEDVAVEVYEQTTKNFGTGRVKTAWLRLGLLLTKRGSPEKAVTCFQSALRSDPSDSHIWECLGDAYIARGSYMAALKAFQKALEIDPSSLYCRYKIGIIKQSVCIFPEAIEEFKKALATQDDHIPALRGIAECHLRLEYTSISENFDGRAVDHALEVLLAASRAVELRPDLRCFWKIMADAAFALRVIADDKLRIAIPPQILKIVGLSSAEDGSKKQIILDLSRRCYGVVVKLDESAASSWHDFSLSSFHYGMLVNGETGKTTMQQSIQFIKKAISLEPQNAKMWNTLGVISGSSDIANPELSQHAFIKALQLERQNAEIWTNLGTLYLKYDKVQAAHEAFKKAQDADPSYTPAWVGQASIAEIIGNEDAMDLFRHSSELGSHTECYLAYSKWVCFSLKDFYTKKKLNEKRFNSYDMPDLIRKAIANSVVCVQKYTDRVPGNACAFNLLGVLLEHQTLFMQSEEAFKRAYELLSSSDDVDKKNTVLSNLARTLRQSRKYKESIETYLKIQPLINSDDVVGLALSYFLDGQLEQSFQTYEQAFNLTTDEREKSDILAAMGMIGFVTGNSDISRSFLLKSSQTNSPSERGLLALAALGLLSRDHTLANAALTEIQKHPDFGTEEVDEHFALLESAMNILQENFIEAKRSILKLIRRYPGSSRQWNRLAKIISQRKLLVPLELAGRCAQIASEHSPSNMSSMIISAASIGSKSFASKLMDQKSQISALRAAQNAVHSNPGQPENWALLSAAALSRSLLGSNEAVRSTAISTARLALLKAEENIACLEETLKSSVSQQLEARIKIAISLRIHAIKQLIWACLHDAGFDMSFMLSDNAATQYEDNVEICNELNYLKAICEILLMSKNGENVEGLVASAWQMCDEGVSSVWKNQVFSILCMKLGLPLMAEFALRKCIQNAVQNELKTTKYTSLVQLALISVSCFSKDKNERWTSLVEEALKEAANLNPDDNIIDLIRMASFHIQGDTKKAAKIFGRIKNQNGSLPVDLLKAWMVLYGADEKTQEIVDKDLYEVQNWT